jgi:DNA-binding NarL/FixJ family response regulator
VILGVIRLGAARLERSGADRIDLIAGRRAEAVQRQRVRRGIGDRQLRELRGRWLSSPGPPPRPALVIRILIADDQALVRGGFHSILAGQDDIEVVGEAGDGQSAADAAARLRPDVVLMDMRMPGVDGIEATRRISARGLASRVLVLTTFDPDEYVYDAMKAGASGFLLKTAPPRQLADAVRTVAAGEALLAPSLTRRLIEQFVRRPAPGTRTPPGLEELTERELEVLRLIAQARSNAEIAATLIVSEATVKSHVNRILTTLRIRDRAQAIVLVYETALVEPRAQTPPAT